MGDEFQESVEHGGIKMGNVIQQGHDPISNTEQQVTITREEFKEGRYNAPSSKQIWSKDVYLRSIEKLGRSDEIVYEPNGGGSQTFNYDVIPIEHFSSILFKVWLKNPDGTFSLSDNWSGKIAVNIQVIEHDTEVGTSYPDCITSNGCGVKKIPGDWISQAGITAIAQGNENGTYVFEVFGERSYDVDTEIGDINVELKSTEAEPIIVHPEQYITKEMIKSITIIDPDLNETQMLQADIDKLFDKDCDTKVTLAEGYTWRIKYKMALPLKEWMLQDDDNLAIELGYAWTSVENVRTPLEGYTTAKVLVIDHQVANMEINNPPPIIPIWFSMYPIPLG